MSDVDLGIWNKLTRVVVFLILLAIVIGVAVWYLPLIQQNERMRKDIHRKEQLVQQEEQNQKQLKAAIESISSDPQAIERVARDKFGYAKPNEIVVRFEETPTNSASFR